MPIRKFYFLVSVLLVVALQGVGRGESGSFPAPAFGTGEAPGGYGVGPGVFQGVFREGRKGETGRARRVERRSAPCGHGGIPRTARGFYENLFYINCFYRNDFR